jgi:hypothetical protein
MTKAIPVILLSAFKFLPCPSLAVVMGFSFWETLLITVPSGIAGTAFFFLTANFLMERSRKRKLNAVQQGKRKVRQFTWINKVLIRIKQRFGLIGIALITPSVLSIPLGSIVMAKFFKHKKEALPALMASVAFWGVVLTFLSIRFNLKF